MSTSPPAGWYADPDRPGEQRWWDGRRWLPSGLAPQPGNALAPPSGAWPGQDAVGSSGTPVQPSTTRPRRGVWRWVVGSVVAVVVLAGGCAALLGRAVLPHGDAANAYLDAVRAGDRAAAAAELCGELDDERWERDLQRLAGSSHQDLRSVNVTNGFGEATGRLEFSDPSLSPAPITVLTLSRDGGACVRGF